MNYNFRSYNPNQPYLLPPSLDDWLLQDHLARFISETVDQMDLSALITAYRANGQGSAAYHPAMMVKVLLYAYCVGIPSSRKIAKALIEVLSTFLCEFLKGQFFEKRQVLTHFSYWV
jgi:transposase